MRAALFGALLLAGLLAADGPFSRAAIAATRPVDAPGSLRLSTFTDTLPGTAATAFHALAGDTVRRIYILHNDGLLPLTDVSVHDPDVSSAVFRCGLGDGDEGDDGADGEADDGADLGPFGWTACSATFTARVGEHESTVSATGSSLIARRFVSAEDTAGYTAIAPGLTVSVTFGDGSRPGGSLPAGAAVVAAVRVTNSGSTPLAGLRPVPPLPFSGFGCPAGSAVPALAPGGSAVCTGTLRVAPGRHDSGLSVAGTWLWDRAITGCGPRPPRSFPIKASADASYIGVTPPTSPPPPPPAPPPAPHARPAAVAVPVRPPSTPPPSPPRSTPPPTGHALPRATIRFVAARGLSFPLKVLAIVVIPGVAAVRRFASRR